MSYTTVTSSCVSFQRVILYCSFFLIYCIDCYDPIMKEKVNTWMLCNILVNELNNMLCHVIHYKI